MNETNNEDGRQLLLNSVIPQGTLRDNAVQQRLILEAAKDYAIFSTDLQRRVTTWNAGAETLFGYAEADIIGQPADILFVPEDRPHAPEYEFGKAQTEGRAENERWHLRKDGARIYGSGVVTPLHDEDGATIGLVKIMRDLTRQKQAEEALSQSEERFRAFVTATSDVVYRMSADWQEMYHLVGKSFLSDTGNTNVSWVEQYIPPQDQAGVRAAIGEVIQAKKTFELEHRVIQADGSVGWTFSRAIPILNERGEIMEWFGTASDITEYKQAEEALARSEKKYRTLFNSIDEGFCTVEVLFDEQRIAVDYRFLETNPAFIRQTGLENAIGKNMRELAPDHESFWFETYGRIAQTGEAMRFEHQATALDRFYDVYAFCNGESAENSVAILFNDITDRKRREANLVFLAETSADFAPMLSAADIMEHVGERLGRHLHLSRCVFSVIDNEADRITALYEWRREDVTASVLGTYPISALLTEAGRQHYAAGKLAVIPDTQDNWVSKAPPALLYEIGNKSIVNAPYLENGRWTFLLTVMRSEVGEWHTDETELIEELAARIYPRIERARAEEALAKSEEKYRWLFETMNLGFSINEAIRDESGEMNNYRFLELNPAFTKLTGIDAGEAVGKAVLEVLPSLDPLWLTTFQQLLDSKETAHIEQFVPQLDRWYTVTAFYYREEQFAAYYSDITERKRHEANLTFLAEVGQDLSGLTNIDETMNALGAKIGGHFKVADVVFGEMSDDEQTIHINHEWHRANSSVMKGAYPTKNYLSPEFEHLHRVGQIAIVRNTAQDERVDAAAYATLGIGTFVNMPLIRQDKWRFNFALLDANPRDWRDDEIELMRELTTRIWTRLERARAEEALAKSEEKYRMLFNSIDEGVSTFEVIVDGQGKAVNVRYLENNSAVVKTLGVELTVGKTAREVLPDIEEHWMETVGHIIRTGEPVRTEYTIKSLDKWISAYFLRVGGPGSRNVVGVYNDITERKRHEANLVFLAQVSHDLAGLTNIEATMNQLGAKIGRHFSASVCAFSDVNEEAGFIVAKHDWHRADVPSTKGTYRIADYHTEAFRTASRAGETYIIYNSMDDPRVNGPNMAAASVGAYVNVPLVRDGKWLFNITVIDIAPRNWRTDETDLVRELIARIWTRLERARAEEALVESEEKYRSLFDSMHQGFGIAEIIVDEAGRPVDYRMLEINPQFEKLIGQPRENYLDGRTVRQIVPELEEDWYEFYGNVALTGIPAHRDIHAEAWNRWFEVASYRAGRPEQRRVAILYSDITERKQAEERQAYLLRLTDVLRPLAVPADIQFEAASLLSRQLGANRVGYAKDGGDGETVVVSHNHTSGVLGIEGVYRYADFGIQLMGELRVGHMVVRDDIASQTDLTPAEKQAHAVLQLGATVNVPLVKQGELLAILFVHFAMPHTFSQNELGLIEETAERTWAAVERAKSEAALRESQRFVQGIITSLPLVIYLFDLVERKNLYLSPQITAVFGYGPDEMQTAGPNLLPTYSHPDDLPRIADYFEQIINSTGDAVFSIECRMHHKQRGWIWVVCRDIVYVRDAEGRPTQLLGTAEDITERRETEQTLRQSDERFRTLVQNLPDYAIFQIDTNAIITEWTEGAQRVKGYTAEEAIGQSLALFYTPENLAAGEMINEIAEATRHGRAERGSVRIRKGGQRFWVDEIMTAIHDEAGRLLGFTKISRDITQRKKADEALFDSRQRLQIVLDSIADHAIITFDLQHRIVSWNPGAWQMFGYTAEEAIGQSGEIFFTPEDRAAGQMEREMRMAREQGRAPDERYHLRKDGSRLYVSGAMAPLYDADKTLLGYVKVARDLTGRLQIEQALREADRRKDEFLALLAHELRNPLATLSNTLLILQLTGGNHEAMPMPAATTMMIREVAHLVRLVDDLLDVSRISRGKIVLTLKRTDLVSVVRETAEAAQGGFRAANRTLTVDLPTESVYLSGDATRLKQVVSNLLNNALKFTQTGGHVWVSLGTTNEEPGGPMAILRVRDDGIGIAEHDRERIFQMFVQVDSSLGRTQDGLGLGLTLVSELVGLHGGRVAVHSEVEGGRSAAYPSLRRTGSAPPTGRRGSEFIIYLPIESEKG